MAKETWVHAASVIQPILEAIMDRDRQALTKMRRQSSCAKSTLRGLVQVHHSDDVITAGSSPGRNTGSRWSCCCLKKISRKVHPHEVEIGQFLSSEPLASDPCNHCVPILEVLQDPEDKNIQLLVMPLLHMCITPDFVTVGEVVKFFRQAFEVGPVSVMYSVAILLLL